MNRFSDKFKCTDCVPKDPIDTIWNIKIFLQKKSPSFFVLIDPPPLLCWLIPHLFCVDWSPTFFVLIDPHLFQKIRKNVTTQSWENGAAEEMDGQTGRRKENQS